MIYKSENTFVSFYYSIRLRTKKAEILQNLRTASLTSRFTASYKKNSFVILQAYDS